jgi:Nucleoside H+ symporter
LSDRLTIAQQIELMALLFLHGMALASWFVPLSSVLQQAGLDSIKSLAYSASAVAAMLSPLFFGAMADRAVAPAKVLRWISLATAALVGIIGLSVSHNLPAWAILLLIQVQSLLCSPTSSLSGSIVFARLANSQRQFGMIRALGTIGWMVGLWITSGLSLDDRPEAFYLSGFLWLVLGCYTLCLPHELVNTGPPRRLSLRERFGLDALQLLRVHDHRAVFVTAALIAIPFAAFYPQTPKLLNHLGFEKVSAWMSLGQVAEVFALISITSLLHRWRLKWMVPKKSRLPGERGRKLY